MFDNLPPNSRRFRVTPTGGSLKPPPHGLVLGWAWEDGTVFVRVWSRRGRPDPNTRFEDLWFDTLGECIAALGGRSHVLWTGDPWPIYKDAFEPPKRLI